MGGDDFFSSLLCDENEETLFDLVEDCVGDDSEGEYVEMLLDREIRFGFHGVESLVLGNWIKSARLDSITWILKTRAILGFHFQTAYLSITYFDRFISRRSIDSEKQWAIRLLSVACLSLAAKMEELKVPALSEFQVEEYGFRSRVIQRMELLVLNTLEWKMGSITPFAYIHFFIRKFCQDSPPRNAVSRTVELLLATMKEISLMDHRPSVIAAAAILVALDRRLTRTDLELKISFIPHFGFLEMEDAFSCYNLMQELEMEKPKRTKFVKFSADISPTQLRPIDGFENCSVTSAISKKRKRLTFSNCDQDNDIPIEK